MCKGNKKCITEIWSKALPGVAVPAMNAGVDISKAFVKQYWLFMGKSPASAAALARWHGAAVGAQSLALIGPALEFYCADGYIEGACGAAGNYGGAAAGAASGAAACAAGGPVGVMACGIGGAIAGAWGGGKASKAVCATIVNLFEGQ